MSLSFTISLGQLSKRLDVGSNQPAFSQYRDLISKGRFGYSTLRDVSQRIFSGSTPLAKGSAYTTEAEGIPFIKSGDITDDGEVSAAASSFIRPAIHRGPLRRSQLEQGDLLIAIVGATIGKVGVFNHLGPANVNQAVAVVRLDPERVLPEFACWYLLSPLGQHIISLLKRPVARANINLAEIGSIPLPTPPLDVQRSLVSEMSAARQSYQSGMEQTKQLLSSVDVKLESDLGIARVRDNKARTLMVNLTELRGALNPERYLDIELERCFSGTAVSRVGAVSMDTLSPARSFPDTVFDLIRIDDLPAESLSVTALRTQPGSDLQGIYFAPKPGDILISRLGPPLRNGKIVFAPISANRLLASPEFLVFRCDKSWNSEFVLWVFRNRHYRDLMLSRCRGATPSRYRLHRHDFEALPFPDVDRARQDELVDYIHNVVQQSQMLLNRSKEAWTRAMQVFDEKLTAHRH